MARAAGSRPSAFEEATATLVVASSPDLAVLEQRLLALAVHPSGLRAAEAWVLALNPRSRCFEGQRACLAPLAGSLESAVRSPAGLDGPRSEAFRLHRVPPQDLDPLVHQAWARGTATHGRCGRTGAPWDGREVGVVPLRRDLRPYGLLIAAGASPEDLEAFHRMAGLAVDAVEAGAEVRCAARQASALREVARAAAGSHNLAEVLRLITRVAAHATGARGSALWLTAGRNGPRLEATHGPAGQRESLGRALTPLAAVAAESGRPLASEHAAEDVRLPAEARDALQSVAVVPIAAFETTLGAIAVYDRATLHPSHGGGFDAAAQEFLRAVADIAAGAVDAAARADAARAAAARIEELRRRAQRRELLAELGERAARIGREARNPLASIAAFARRVHRALAEGSPQREYLEIVVREAERLERLMAEQAGLAAAEPPGLRVESLNPVVQEALQQCGESLVRRRVRLLKRLAPDVPALLLDPARIRQVVRNVVQHAVDRVPVGGRIRVESRRVGEFVVVDVAHDGPRRAGELLEALFLPFATGEEDAGLAAAQRVVREHGGEVRLRSDGGTTVVSFTLPVPGNQERRRAQDRRVIRGDRRAASR
jgi:signal transduction histidine kinase